MFYLVFAFLVAALASSSAAFVLLSLLWRRSHIKLLGILLKLELFIVLVLVVNFVGFIVESSIEQPDRRLLFLLMSLASFGVSGMTWQAASFAFALIGRRRGPTFDASFLAGSVFIYIVSVFFSLSWGGPGGIEYDNSVGYKISSIVSALVSTYFVIVVLAQRETIDEKWRKTAKGCALFILIMNILSIINETVPVARLLGLAQLPLSPFLLIALNGMAIAMTWRRLDSHDGERKPQPILQPRDGALFDETTISLAVDCLQNRFALSAREKEIASLLIAGTPNPEIATRLYISVFTVKNHVHSIFSKTGAESRMDLLRIANALAKE